MASSAYGTVSGNGTTEPVVVNKLSTLSAHLESGSGLWTWQFRGTDGVWRDLYGGDGTVVQSYSGSHMVNVNVGGNVVVRGVSSNSTAAVWDWQVMGDPLRTN